MLPVVFWFLGPSINLTGGVFTTGAGLSAFMLYFVNRTTGRWSAPYFINADFADEDTSVD